MIKVIILLLMVCASTLIGYSFSLGLRQRKINLQVFIEALHRMKSLISFSGYDIDRVISLSFEDIKGFQNFDVDNADTDIYTRWVKSSKEFVSACGLKPCDEAVILRFGESLGVTDTEGQLMNCDLYLQLLSELQRDAKEEEDNKSRLYRILGFSSGAVAALFIL